MDENQVAMTETMPWYERNEVANRAQIAWLTYERAVREGIGVEEARTTLLAVMRVYEGTQLVQVKEE